MFNVEEFQEQERKQFLDQVNHLLYKEKVLSQCYTELFEYIVCGLESGYDKELILKLSKEKLLETKDLLD